MFEVYLLGGAKVKKRLPGELATGLIVYSHVVATVVASPFGNSGF